MKKISVEELEPGMQLSRDVTSGVEVVFESCLLINSEHIVKLKEAGVEEVHIIDTASLNDKAQAWDRLLEKGFDSARENTVALANEFLDRVAQGETEKALGEREPFLNLLGEILEDGNVLVKLAGIKTVDNYLYAHCVNTTVLAILLSQKLDFERERQMDIGRAALMADVGMMLVPSSIWEHRGALSEEQRSEVQKHVEHSRAIVSAIPGTSQEVTDTVYQHHERCDGSGYPQGLRDEDIIIDARIVAVSDVFAAIREPRVYREQSGPIRALKAITSSQGFDPEVMRRFLATVSIYPVQSFVMLSDGSIGRVSTVRENNPFRPVVEIVKDSKGKEVTGGTKIDLMNEENMSLYIEDALDQLPE